MPFAMNEATRFISPTKTPGYLAAGRQVVSIPLRDVVRHYGDLFAVHIADGAAAFARACETALAATAAPAAWRDQADAALATQSWDTTFRQMNRLVAEAAGRRRGTPPTGDRFPARYSPQRAAV